MPLKKQDREARVKQEQEWIEQGRASFKSGLTLDQFLEAVTKRTALWYRMKGAFEEGRRQATENAERNNPTPEQHRTRTRVL